jgi:hypothetical protein
LRFFRRRFRAQKLFGAVGYEKEVMDTPSVSPQRVTELLAHSSHGDDAALAELTPLVYEELRLLAHRHIGRERPDHTLQTKGLLVVLVTPLLIPSRAEREYRVMIPNYYSGGESRL